MYALRNAGLRGGDLVAVQGIGGLGHLGVQFARHMGSHPVALGRGADKKKLGKELGAARLCRYRSRGCRIRSAAYGWGECDSRNSPKRKRDGASRLGSCSSRQTHHSGCTE
jgi:NADPH:quinone reductase-like Zn-dependent oxidoreductase